MLARSVEGLADPRADLLPRVQKVFETIGFAKVSTSAADAARLGFLRDVDAITMNRERLMADAKAVALERVREGYRPPAPRTAIPVGGDAVLAPLKLGVHLAWRAGRISDHDAAASAGRWPAFSPAARCRTRRPCPSSTCSISSARRSSSCAASARRWSGSSTR